jgi:hypothetical protein
MKTSNLIVVCSILTFGAAALWAHEHQMPPRAPNSKEFDQLKQLVGTWQGMAAMENGKPGPTATQFKLTAAGSAIEETLMPGTPKEMVDMYTDEGGKLAMVHYCAVGNRPHMVVKQSTPTQIVLEMVPTAGIDAGKDMHMHALTLEFPDANHLTERWVSYENGKAGEASVFTFARVPTK